MNTNPNRSPSPLDESERVDESERAVELERAVEQKARRKLDALATGKRSPWFGLGMFGLVGWSIVLPTLLGVAVGSWIDDRWPSHISWKLTLLFVGITLGCVNAWVWIQKETRHELD